VGFLRAMRMLPLLIREVWGRRRHLETSVAFRPKQHSVLSYGTPSRTICEIRYWSRWPVAGGIDGSSHSESAPQQLVEQRLVSRCGVCEALRHSFLCGGRALSTRALFAPAKYSTQRVAQSKGSTKMRKHGKTELRSYATRTSLHLLGGVRGLQADETTE